MSRRSILLLLLIGLACSDSETTRNSGSLFDKRTRAGTLTARLQVGIGAVSASKTFGTIRDIWPIPDGSVWILDVEGVASFEHPRIRAFDSLGKFVRQIGREGKGTGEYEAPTGMAMLKDGRVVVRDNGWPERVHVYRVDGAVDSAMILDGRTNWPRDTRARWGIGMRDPIRVDVTGATWLPFDMIIFDSDTGASIGVRYIRVRPKGEFMGIVDSPDLPVVRVQRIRSREARPPGGAIVRGVHISYQPHSDFAWNPNGTFSVARTDRYEILQLAPIEVQDPLDSAPPMPINIRRTVRGTVITVSVSHAERDSIRVALMRDLKQLHVDTNVILPELPRSKPAITRFRYADDGQLLVWLAQPSALVNGVWIEPQVVDVFDQAGMQTGQIKLPEAFHFVRLTGRTVWGIETDASKHEVPVRYTIQW